jgi:hypothetical protein
VEVVTVTKPEELPELHWRVLGAIPNGQENSIAISYLMENLRISQSNRRHINTVINDLIFKFGYPIGTSSERGTKGIFFIDNEDDLSLACRTMNSRAMASLKRHKQIIQNFNNLSQLELEVDN